MNEIIDKKNEIEDELYDSIRKVLIDARNQAYRAINSNIVLAYWNIGRLIVEDELNGTFRADYGQNVLRTLSKKLKHIVLELYNKLKSLFAFSKYERVAFVIDMDSLS